MTRPPDHPRDDAPAGDGATPRIATDETGFPAPPHVPTGGHNDLGEPEAFGEHGRVGYGRLGRYTPFLLALVIIAVLVAIGINQSGGRGDDDTIQPPPTPQVGDVAPDVTLTRLDGQPFTLSSLRGSVVVLNFWASWCDPCREEMPLLNTVDGTATADGTPIQVVGVGIVPDRDEAVRQFVADLGVTYTIGRDTGGSGVPPGPVQGAYDIADYYLPSTVFIGPDGTITAVHYGEMTQTMIDGYVETSVESGD